MQVSRSKVSKLRRGDRFQPAIDGLTNWVTVIKARPSWSGEVEVWVERDVSILLPGDLDISIQR